MKNIGLNFKHSFINFKNSNDIKNKLIEIENNIRNKNCAGNDFLGWLDLPLLYENDIINQITEAADKIKNKADAIVSIGIGGSYLGAKAVIESVNGVFNNLNSEIPIYFAGNNISGNYLNELLKILETKKNIFLIVISKSGTTTEPAIAFRILKNFLIQKYNDKINEHIYVVTDKEKGALRIMADKNNWTNFIIPDDVGGRFSVLTPVGLLPISCADINIKKLMRGAYDIKKICDSEDFNTNISMQYALARFLLHTKSEKDIEILVNYQPQLHYIAEWWKQLFGESEGKNNKSIFPASCDFTTDLHSMGQWIQDGVRNIFETVLNIENQGSDLTIPFDTDNLDNLNYISDKTLDYVNRKAMEGTLEAHIEGKVPNIQINIPEINEYYLGQMIYFFEKACAYSGYLLNVNPFNQPGVEAYKKNMFRLLGKN